MTNSLLERLSTRITQWAERWFPDSYVFAILASLLNWALSLVFGGLYVRALARRTDQHMDYRSPISHAGC